MEVTITGVETGSHAHVQIKNDTGSEVRVGVENDWTEPNGVRVYVTIDGEEVLDLTRLSPRTS